MKGLILSGGKGTRLRPLTFTSAKQLIPVANKPVLFYGIEALRDAGIKEIGIIVGETREEIQHAVGDGRRFGVRVTYIYQKEPLGLAHAVLTAQPYLQESPFVMYLGDNLIKGGVREFVKEFATKKANALILLSPVPNPQNFGVVTLVKGKVAALEEKPKKPKSDLALVGVYLFDHHVFQACRTLKPSWRNELEITDAIQTLVNQGYTVLPHLITGWWKDTGKVEDILEANRMVLEELETSIQGKVDEASEITGRVVIEKGAVITKSTIRGPVIIGGGAVIARSYIGPFTSIASKVTILESELEYSIVMEESKIQGIGTRIETSLIGKGVEVSRADGKPKTITLMLGDQSRVGIA